MEHLAQDLSVALEESESCGPINFDNTRKWGMRRRTRSAGNLNVYAKTAIDNSDDSTSSNSELRTEDKSKIKPVVSFHQSDSDDMSLSFCAVTTRAINNRTQSLRMKHPIHTILKGRCSNIPGMSHSLESDSLNENSPARPSLRRKRKLKRMSVDETPIPPCGKRKRPQQRIEIFDGRTVMRCSQRIKPLHQSVVDKIEKFCQQPLDVNYLHNEMESSSHYEQCDVDIGSESSLSWSGGEGHEGDDELTDWAPTTTTTTPNPLDNTSMDQSGGSTSDMGADSREMRAGCRRLGDERPGFSISTGANERVARFMQDSSKTELKLSGGERDKLTQLASLYSLDLWFDPHTTTSSLLRKTERTPCMQPTQRHHHGAHNGSHKKIRTLDHIIS